MKNTLRYKLFHFEATPPETAWEEIAHTLDELNRQKALSDKLHRLESPPPESVWEKINYRLREDQKEGIEINNRKNITWIRYAAAAVVIGVISFSAVWIVSKSIREKPVAVQQNNLPVLNPVSKDLPKNSLPVTAPGNASYPGRDDLTREEGKQIFAANDFNTANETLLPDPELITRPVARSRYRNIPLPEDTYRDIYYSCISSAVHLESDKYNTTDRYVLLMTPDGNIIRMSKKWGDLLCCISGSDQDDQCRDQLNKWRTKIAEVPVALSAGNFHDILDLVNSLNENLP